jgi:hypothetical protein
MEDQDVAASEGATAEPAQGAEEKSTPKAAGIESIDPKVLKAHVDREVTRAIKAREENLKKQEELIAAEERGEFGKLREGLEGKIAELTQKLVEKDVMHSLHAIASEHGLIDMDDLSLITSQAVDAAVGDDGSVNADKLRAVVAKFKEAKPHKFGNGNKAAEAFRGAATPPSPAGVSEPPALGPDSTDGYIKARNEALKRLKSAPRPRSQLDLVAEAVARKMKG